MPWYRADRPGKKPKFVFCKSCDAAARRILANDRKASVWNLNRFHRKGEKYPSTDYVARGWLGGDGCRVRITKVDCHAPMSR